MYQLETCLWMPMVVDRDSKLYPSTKEVMARLLELKQQWEHLKEVECFLTNGSSAGYPRLDIYLHRQNDSAMICIMAVYAIEIKDVRQLQQCPCRNAKEVVPVI
jgi:hypothetical protein